MKPSQVVPTAVVTTSKITVVTTRTSVVTTTTTSATITTTTNATTTTTVATTTTTTQAMDTTQTVQSGPFIFTIEDGVAALTEYTGSATEVIVPATVNGYAVTEIGNRAFSNHKEITSLTISQGITEIGASAFNGCSGLKTVSISMATSI